jgi:hypothetical protein
MPKAGLAEAQSRLQDIQGAEDQSSGDALLWYDQGNNGIYEGARGMGVCKLSDGGTFDKVYLKQLH